MNFTKNKIAEFEVKVIAHAENNELYYAHEQAKQFRAKNKFSELSLELQIATYKFRWTDKNCYLDNVIAKGGKK